MPICSYSAFCQPVMTFTPKRPGATESTVAAMRATTAGGISRLAAVANRLMRFVTAASAAISVNGSSEPSQYCDSPPKPRNFTIESAKSIPYRSPASTMSRLSANVGSFIGAVDDVRYPRLPVGRKSPSSMAVLLRRSRQLDSSAAVHSCQSTTSCCKLLSASQHLDRHVIDTQRERLVQT